MTESTDEVQPEDLLATSQGSRHKSGVQLDADGRIDESVQCRKCLYDLRGIRPGARCPECGKEVEWSLAGDQMRFADTAWLKKLYTGINLLLICYLLSSVNTVMLYSGLPLRFSNTDQSNIEEMRRTIEFWRIMGWCITALITCLYIFAYLRMTAPERTQKPQKTKLLASAARWTTIAAILILLGVLGLKAWKTDVDIVWIEFGASLLRVVGHCAMIIYLGALADRLLDRTVQRTCRVLAMISAVIGVAFIVATIPVIHDFLVTPTPSGVGLIVGGVMLASVMACSIAFLFVLIRLRRKLITAYYDAQRHDDGNNK